MSERWAKLLFHEENEGIVKFIPFQSMEHIESVEFKYT